MAQWTVNAVSPGAVVLVAVLLFLGGAGLILLGMVMEWRRFRGR